MSRELIERVGRDADDARRYRREQTHSNVLIQNNCITCRSTEPPPDYAPVAAFAGAFSGCLTTLNLTAFGLAPGIASALATALLCGQLLVTRTTNLFPGAFFPALYGGTFGGMTSAFGLSDGTSGRSATLTGALVIALSIVCGLAFFVVAKLDARSTDPIASGYGGRSGAIATLASFLFVVSGGLLGAEPARSPLSRKPPVSPSPLALAGLLRLCLCFGDSASRRRGWQIEYLSHQWRRLLV
jgi:hypothetical protein